MQQLLASKVQTSMPWTSTTDELQLDSWTFFRDLLNHSHSQFVEQIRLWQRGQRRGRRRVGWGWSSAGMLSALAQIQHMLKADVCLGAAVHAVGHAHGHWHLPSRSSSWARPSPSPPFQDAGQPGVSYVKGGISRQARQLLCIHLWHKSTVQ